MRAHVYNSDENIKYVQKNIRKKHNKYQVRKGVRGVTIIKSFDRLNDARTFLKTLV